MNIITNPKYKDIAKALRKKLDAWLKDTNDPILKGKINPQAQVRFKYDNV